MNPMPTLFISHGAPTFALDPGRAGALLASLGNALPKPHAVLVISPHWMTTPVRVSTAIHQKTIHDFAGFDERLYDIQYAARGHPEIAQRVIDLLKRADWLVEADAQRGLDHGAWVPLRYLFPDASVPVFQLSLPHSLDAETALELGRLLRPLTDEGMLIVGSGSLTHNLYEFRIDDPNEAEYAKSFVAWVREAVNAADLDRLARTLKLAPHAARAHPTTEHFLPLLIAAAAASTLTPTTVLQGGIEHGVLSMESYAFGFEAKQRSIDTVLNSALIAV
ncbi:MAG: dioxygenase family protein [Casimicrobium sp.]